MPRKMSPEKEKEFEELSLFLEYYSTIILGIDRGDDIHPSNALVEIVENFGKSKALQGLKQAINDTIEDTSRLDIESVRRLDAELLSRGILSLSELRKRYWSKYRRIIKRGSLKSETEYYLVNGLLCDLSADISSNEREFLNNLLVEFESNV